MECLDSARKFRLSYLDSGIGMPVFFIHGWCMSSGVWQMQEREVSSLYRFIAIDMNGHGESGVPAEGSGGFEGYAADIIELIDRLDLSSIVAVGWSMGAQALLYAYPAIRKRLAGIVLVGATPRFTAAPHFPFALPPSEASGMMLKVRRNLDRALEGFKKNLFSSHEDGVCSSEKISSVIDSLPLPSSISALDGLEALMEEEVIEQLSVIDIPVLIIHGSCDTICLPAASEYLEKAVSTSVRICYEGIGHAPFLTCPDRFNRDLLFFLNQVHYGH